MIFRDEKKRNYVSVWNRIQRFASYPIYRRTRVSAFIIDETVIQIGSQHFWLWHCIEPVHSFMLGIYSSEEKNMLVAEKFIRSLVDNYGRDPIYTEAGTWYPEACNVIGLKHKPSSLISSCVISDTILLFIR